MKERRQVTAWLKPETHERLRLACQARGLSVADVIEKGIEAMLDAHLRPQEAADAPQSNGAQSKGGCSSSAAAAVTLSSCTTAAFMTPVLGL